MKFNTGLIRIFGPLAVMLAVLVIALPKTPKLSLDYRKGQPWKEDSLIAPFDFPILKTESQIEEERASSARSVIPYYKYSDEVVNKNIRVAEGLQFNDPAFRQTLVKALRQVYSKGVVGDDGIVVDQGRTASDVLYIQRNKRASLSPVSEVYKLADARAKLHALVLESYPKTNVDSVFREAGAYELVVPNLVYDKQTTQLVHSGTEKEVSPTVGYVTNGQLIVSKGEIVTAEIAQMLYSYQKEYDANMGYANSSALVWIGNILLALAMVAILYFILYFSCPSIFSDFSRYSFLLLIYLIFSLAAIIGPRVTSGLIYAIPFTLCALLLQAFFPRKVAVPIYVACLAPVLLYPGAGSVVFTMYLLSGLATIYSFGRAERAWHQIITAAVTFVVLVVTFLGFRSADLIGGGILHVILLLLISSVLTIAGFPVIFLFERIFDLTSNSRLAELCDTSHPLLRELEQKAPGTYHHCLQVMNLCDAVARAIGANAALVRAGALYHDLGKMNNPFCFVENESMLPEGSRSSYHSKLTPVQSAKDIIQHVADGIAIAQKKGLPSSVVDFIRTHHGTTLTTYFYNMYVQQGGDPAEKAAFTYPGPAPQTKEQVILSLCDSVEAASRTMPDNTPESISNCVERIVAGKEQQGQFANADITIRELGIVKDVLKSCLAQMYHERIAYPERNK